jgi:hypothetical protein
LATIRIDGEEMGRALMTRLLDWDPPTDYVAPVELVERASLRAPDFFRSPSVRAAQCDNSVTSLDTPPAQV